MAEPALSAAAAHVRAFDPDLFATALFAPEPARERLMALYAFDVELSRAADTVRNAETGPIIAAMRLQFWRDTLEEAGQGAPPRGHEIAAPLHALVAEGHLPAGALSPLVDAREREVDGTVAEDFDGWAEARFGALTAAAGTLLGGIPEAAARSAGQALGRAFALRVEAPLRPAGRALLPEAGEGAYARTAEEGRAALAEARRVRGETPRAATPALLPLWRAEQDIAAVSRDPASAAAGLPAPSPSRRTLALTWRALSGRW